MTEQTVDAVEQVLREELVRGDAILASARPILRHLLANDDRGLFSEEMIARIRGMMTHLATQLLFAQAEAAGAEDRAGYVADREDDLAQILFEDTGFLAHAHARTIEAQLAVRLQGQSGIDAVLSPLVQELIGAREGEIAALAMTVLASQARFMQHHRRMELPLRELPGDLFHKALVLMREHAGDEAADAAERNLRTVYEEGASRLGLLAHLVTAMSEQSTRALAIDHAGLAIFATALAMASRQDRDLTVLSFVDRQFARLALSLRAAGLKQQAISQQFLVLHPEVALPEGFDLLRADRAMALLAGSQPEPAL